MYFNKIAKIILILMHSLYSMQIYHMLKAINIFSTTFDFVNISATTKWTTSTIVCVYLRLVPYQVDRKVVAIFVLSTSFSAYKIRNQLEKSIRALQVKILWTIPIEYIFRETIEKSIWPVIIFPETSFSPKIGASFSERIPALRKKSHTFCMSFWV